MPDSEDEPAQLPWKRALEALEKVLEESPSDRTGIELVWRIAVEAEVGVEVAPWVFKLNKKGKPGAGARLGRRRLLLQYGDKLSPEDARVATLLPEGDAFAPRALLEALVDHPRVFRADVPDVGVRVERAPVGLVAEDRNGVVRLTAGIDGTALPAPTLDRVRRSGAEDVIFLWDGGRLTLLDIKPELRALVGVLHREGNLFPPEGRVALLESLAKWAQHMPVAMPRSVMGESVLPAAIPVVRMEAQSTGAVQVELRVRALPDSPAFVPGVGPRDVHVRRGDKAVHAVRNLREEVDRANALVAVLPLLRAEALDAPFQYSFDDAHGALELLEACAHCDPPPQLEWVGVPLRVLGSRGTTSLRVVLQRRREWFGVLGDLSVQGERVELARLLDAVRRKERFVKVEGHSYVELTDALRSHLEILSDHAHSTARGLEVGPSAAAALHALAAEGASLDADDVFRRLAARMEAARTLDAPVPAALQVELRSYQIDGFRWLTRLAAWGAGALLADDMGLGKTVQTLALLLTRAELGPAMVVAPTSVAFNWVDEARRFAPSLRFLVYADATNRERMLADLGPGDVLVTSYGLLVRDSERIATQTFATLVFDEAQALKNATSQRFRAARSLRADFKIALSGTPIENHLGELWALFTVVFPGLLGSWETFRSRYAAPIEKQTDPGAAAALSRVVEPFLLRRTKDQVAAELPPRIDVRVPVVLSSAEWTLYEDARLSALSDLHTRKSKLREQDRRIEVLAALTRLRLLASHPRLYDARSEVSSAKLGRFMALVEELCAERQRALVFSQFTSHLAFVREALEARGIDYVYLDGETPQSARGERVRSFQEGAAPLFLISLKAGGFGLNLTAATNVIHLDPWWNPAVEDQASDRAHRLGQTRPVTIYRLIAMGTIEELMLQLHTHKRSIVAQVLAGTDEAVKLSTQDLIDLLSPGRGGPRAGASGGDS